MAGCAQLPSFHMRLQGRAGTATAGAHGSGPPGREDLHEGPPAPASRGSRSPSAPVPLAHPGGIGTTGWAARPRGPRHVDASGSGPLAENPGRVRKARPLRPPRASVHQTPPPVTRCRAGGGGGRVRAGVRMDDATARGAAVRGGRTAGVPASGRWSTRHWTDAVVCILSGSTSTSDRQAVRAWK